MNLIETGISKKLIKFDEDRNFVTYIHQNKKRSYNNPEEQVQVETFLTLVLIYGYPVGRVKNYVSVQMGSETKEADIIVYADDACEKTHIVVECKKEVKGGISHTDTVSIQEPAADYKTQKFSKRTLTSHLKKRKPL